MVDLRHDHGWCLVLVLLNFQFNTYSVTIELGYMYSIGNCRCVIDVRINIVFTIFTDLPDWFQYVNKAKFSLFCNFRVIDTAYDYVMCFIVLWPRRRTVSTTTTWRPRLWTVLTSPVLCALSMERHTKLVRTFLQTTSARPGMWIIKGKKSFKLKQYLHYLCVIQLIFVNYYWRYVFDEYISCYRSVVLPYCFIVCLFLCVASVHQWVQLQLKHSVKTTPAKRVSHG